MARSSMGFLMNSFWAGGSWLDMTGGDGWEHFTTTRFPLQISD
jgi:hypothetical protein